MNQDLGKTSCSPSPEFTIHPLSEVDDARPDGEAPAFVTKTVIRFVEREHRGVAWARRVTNEASGSMAVKTNHKEEGQMMRVPESFKALITNLGMRRGVHQDHDEEHEVARYTTSLRVVDLKSNFWANLWETMNI